jgi:hypothetical protein
MAWLLLLKPADVDETLYAIDFGVPHMSAGVPSTCWSTRG